MHYTTATLSENQTYLACFSQSKWFPGVKKDPTMQVTQVFPLCYSKVNEDTKGGWKDRTAKLNETIEISDETLRSKKRPFAKTLKKNVAKLFKKAIEKSGEKKSKVKDGQGGWKPLDRKKYMSKLSRNQVSKIFQTRTRMLNVKDNYRNKYKNNLGCRACGQSSET